MVTLALICFFHALALFVLEGQTISELSSAASVVAGTGDVGAPIRNSDIGLRVPPRRTVSTAA